MTEFAARTQISEMRPIRDIVASLPCRAGDRPHTNPTTPHQQLNQNAPRDVQELLFERARALTGVVVSASQVSVPGARAFFLQERFAKGPREAFMVGREFAHLHPPYDGSLHLVLPSETAEQVTAKGWGELHPAARMGLIPPTALMVYGPRDEKELEAVWKILYASYVGARGELHYEQDSGM